MFAKFVKALRTAQQVLTVVLRIVVSVLHIVGKTQEPSEFSHSV